MFATRQATQSVYRAVQRRAFSATAANVSTASHRWQNPSI